LHKNFALLVAARILTKLRARGHPTTGPVIARANGSLCFLVGFDDSRILFLNLIAALTDNRVQKLLDLGAELLSQVRPGMSLETSKEIIELPKESDIVRLQVVARPQSSAPMYVGGPFITLDDLEWILYTSLKSADDIWFLRAILNEPIIQRECSPLTSLTSGKYGNKRKASTGAGSLFHSILRRTQLLKSGKTLLNLLLLRQRSIFSSCPHFKIGHWQKFRMTEVQKWPIPA
jgi:hypothetical protein